MQIVIVSNDYPDNRRSAYPFVKQLVEEWARQGHDCTVIAPYSITRCRRFYRHICKEQVGSDKQVIVKRPNIITLSTLKFFGIRVSSVTHQRAVEKELYSLERKPDVVYCHFWDSAIEAAKYCDSMKVPLVVASGESVIPCYQEDSIRLLQRVVKGVICVSTKNMEESVIRGLAEKSMCKVFLNAINNNLFYKRDKIKMRKSLDFPIDAFIIVVVGTFKAAKGQDRVAAAINKIEGKPVYSMFVGEGSLSFSCDNILHKGPIMHDLIPDYLNAADVFVLPTRAEGCCNSIIEALACGLPVISSNLPFNWDVLNEENSIMIDPNNIDDIASAIVRLRDDERTRESMSNAALETAKRLTISERAEGIINEIRSRISI